MKKNTDELIHKLVSLSQVFHSYEQLAKNINFKISHKKIQEICRKGAVVCNEIRQELLEYYDETKEGK